MWVDPVSSQRLVKWKREAEEKVTVMQHEKDSTAIPGSEDASGQQSRNAGSWKSEDTDCPQREGSPANISMLAQGYPHETSALRNCNIRSLYSLSH